MEQQSAFRFSEEQADVLENCFKIKTRLNLAEIERLANVFNVPTEKITIWFKNKRAKATRDLKRITRFRSTIPASKVATLRAAYKDRAIPDKELLERLALSTQLSTTVVKIWFQNRRAKDKKKALHTMAASSVNTNSLSGSKEAQLEESNDSSVDSNSMSKSEENNSNNAKTSDTDITHLKGTTKDTFLRSPLDCSTPHKPGSSNAVPPKDASFTPLTSATENEESNSRELQVSVESDSLFRDRNNFSKTNYRRIRL